MESRSAPCPPDPSGSPRRPAADAWDDVINFFIHALSLLDWLESDGLITTAKKRQLVAQAPLSVSRDIANAAKHRHLNRPSHPGGVALVREYAPQRNREEEWVVIGAGTKTTIADLATSVMQELDALVREVRAVDR